MLKVINKRNAIQSATDSFPNCWDWQGPERLGEDMGKQELPYVAYGSVNR